MKVYWVVVIFFKDKKSYCSWIKENAQCALTTSLTRGLYRPIAWLLPRVPIPTPLPCSLTTSLTRGLYRPIARLLPRAPIARVLPWAPMAIARLLRRGPTSRASLLLRGPTARAILLPGAPTTITRMQPRAPTPPTIPRVATSRPSGPPALAGEEGTGLGINSYYPRFWINQCREVLGIILMPWGYWSLYKFIVTPKNRWRPKWL